MNCSRCGTQSNDKFCSECGKSLELLQEKEIATAINEKIEDEYCVNTQKTNIKQLLYYIIFAAMLIMNIVNFVGYQRLNSSYNISNLLN